MISEFFRIKNNYGNLLRILFLFFYLRLRFVAFQKAGLDHTTNNFYEKTYKEKFKKLAGNHQQVS